eukprot:6011146-Amphidinium_carterae.1
MRAYLAVSLVRLGLPGMTRRSYLVFPQKPMMTTTRQAPTVEMHNSKRRLLKATQSCTTASEEKQTEVSGFGIALGLKCTACPLVKVVVKSPDGWWTKEGPWQGLMDPGKSKECGSQSLNYPSYQHLMRFRLFFPLI